MATMSPHIDTRRPKKRPRRWMPWILLGIILSAAVAGLVVATTPAVPSGGDSAQRAAAFIETQLESSAVPAASYAVVEDGRVAVSGAVGDGIHADTPFLVGSLSKSFTALAVMQLVDQGLIGLDEPVTRYIPWFRTADPAVVITVRQLLNQTSGLPTSAGTEDMNNPETTLEQRVRAIADVRPVGVPGETFRYCNKNYAILGLIIERVSGRSYQDYVRERIFAPLEMHNSATDQETAQRAGLASGTASWFGLSLDRSTHPYPGALPDGYLISTAEDMTHYLQAQLDGTYQGRRIVSERGLQLMHSATVHAELYPKRDHYGFGWATGTLHGQRVVSHDGDLPSYYSNLGLLPEQGDGLVMLTARNALVGDKAAPVHGAMEILTGGVPPEITRGFLLTNVVIDALALAVLAFLVGATVRLVRRLGGLSYRIATSGMTRAVLLPGSAGIGLAVITYLAVFLSLGVAMGSGGIMPLATSFGYAPDITALVLAVVGFVAARGAVVLVAGLAARRRLAH